MKDVVTQRVEQEVIGRLPSGERVEAYTLHGSGGVTLRAITLGAIVTHLLVPDRNGHVTDVVLGFDDLAGYLAPHPFFGAIVGRVAGRVCNARFSLDRRTYEVEANDPPNHLHGGSCGFDKQLWQAMPVERDDDASSVRFSRTSVAGEAGYPGNVNVAVTYTVTHDCRPIVDVEATSDRATPFSITQHSYFNLAGEGTIESHELQILADSVAAADESFTLVGRRVPVAGLAGDLRVGSRLVDVIKHLAQRHGDLYFVRRESGGAFVTAARLLEPSSGRVMTVRTTEDCIQLYTGAKLDGELIGKSGRRYGPLAGLCLECEGYPDGVNSPALGDIILRPGRVHWQQTEYAFTNL